MRRFDNRQVNKPQRIAEERAIVMEFLPNGYVMDSRPSHKKTAIVQAIGMANFTLLELVPKKDVSLMPHDEVYIGEGKRDQIHHVNGRLPLGKLTNAARNELEFIINDIISKNEIRFVNFFNKAQPLTMRMHQVELLPGIGKKHMWDILEQREEKPFETFADIKSRVKLLSDPQKAILKRILQEIEGKEKHRLFTE